MNRLFSLAALGLVSALSISVFSVNPAVASEQICWSNHFHEIRDTVMTAEQCRTMLALMEEINAHAAAGFQNRSFQLTEAALAPNGPIINAAHGWQGQSIPAGTYVDYNMRRIMNVDEEGNVIFLYFNDFNKTDINYYGKDGSQTWVTLFLDGATSLNGTDISETISPYFGDVESGSVRNFAPSETITILRTLLDSMK